jgi:hypothetical protein
VGADLTGKNAAILQRAWSEESFRERLRRAPGEVLAEYAIPVPEGTEIVVLEDAPGLSHLVLPPIEAAGESPPAASRAGDGALTRALADPQARRRLLEGPRETLRSMGLSPPAGLEIRVVEDGPGRTHLVLPLPPADGEVADEELLAASGGSIGLAVTVATVVSAGAATAVVSGMLGYAIGKN